VISGNRDPHWHPKPSVMAGLMAYLILDAPVENPSRRVFVTDGLSIQLDYIYDLVTSLISLQNPLPLPPGRWREKVRVHYLNTDFLAEIPVDTSSNVVGVKEIDFSQYATPNDEEYLQFLHNQFKKAKPYDVPRAAISHTSTFRITIGTSQVPFQYLDLDANGLRLATQGTQPNFSLIDVDFLTNVNRWTHKKEPHYVLFKVDTPNPSISDLVFLSAYPASVDFRVYKDNSPTTPPEELHLVNGVISFQPPTGGATQANVQFQRNP